MAISRSEKSVGDPGKLGGLQTGGTTITHEASQSNTRHLHGAPTGGREDAS